MDKVVYVVSDLHLGPGWLPNGELDPLEDFTAAVEFARFLDRIGRGPQPVELVIAGDFLEYCQTLPEIGLQSPVDHLGSTEAESLRRTEVILGKRPQTSSGHPQVFAAMRRFMVEGHSITIIAGNHDIDLLWRRVWSLVFQTVYPPGAAGELRLVEYAYTVGRGARNRIYIEHGHEHDPANRFGDRMALPFALDDSGVRRLKRCWGTLFVDKVYNQLERDRWFIDNVKPIPRVIKLGLRNDFLFTATAMGLITRFLLTSGLPPTTLGGAGVALGGGGGAVLGGSGAAPLAEEAVGALADTEVQAAIAARLSDPAYRAELEQALGGMDAAAWGAVRAGAAAPLTLDSVTVNQGGEVVLGGGGGSSAGGGDTYREAARAVLESDPRITTVIMGHTHGPIDGYVDPIDLRDGRTGYYFNSGTWTRHLKDEAHRSYSWAEIGDDDNYTTSYTYIRLDPDGKGGYKATMGQWQE